MSQTRHLAAILAADVSRTDPSPNVNRFYLVDVMPTLLGDWLVMRECGRGGSPGTMRLASHEHRVDADGAVRRSVRRRLQHGYRVPTARTG